MSGCVRCYRLACSAFLFFFLCTGVGLCVSLLMSCTGALVSHQLKGLPLLSCLCGRPSFELLTHEPRLSPDNIHALLVTDLHPAHTLFLISFSSWKHLCLKCPPRLPCLLRSLQRVCNGDEVRGCPSIHKLPSQQQKCGSVFCMSERLWGPHLLTLRPQLNLRLCQLTYSARYFASYLSNKNLIWMCRRLTSVIST